MPLNRRSDHSSKNSKRALQGFTHSGLEQLVRHRAERDIRPNSSDTEVLEVVTITIPVAFLTTLAVAAFLEETSEYDAATQMFEAYCKRYRDLPRPQQNSL
jgi:hypothetical protein